MEVRPSPFAIREGQVSLWSMHTTCALFINESQKALIELTSRRFWKSWWRATATIATTIRTTPIAIAQNADSHLRALLLGHSLGAADQRR